MATIISFLGGNAFRLIFGEIIAYLNKKQEQEAEIERMRLQGELDAAQHARNLEAIKVQSELGVKTIQVQSDAVLVSQEDFAWAKAVGAVGMHSGIKFLDIWNGAIRPALASVAMAVIIFEIAKNGFSLTEWDRGLFGAILGIYVADRHLSKQGK